MNFKNLHLLPPGILAVLLSFAAAQQVPTVVCVPGQCLQGFSNTTIGASLSASGAPTSLRLLPGQYTSSTNPQLLHDILTSSSASLDPSPGFGDRGAPSLPLTLDLDPGISIFAQSFYSGQAAFAPLPNASTTNSSTPISAGSIVLSSNIWVALNSGSNRRIVLWDSVPDLGQIPALTAGQLSLVDTESSACSPACASSGVCSTSGTCTCSPGFTGSSCESCASGFFGPSCLPCPAGCSSCDEGITGSGRCLVSTISNAPASCNCLNGVCGSNGSCTCNPGWTSGDNGTACAKCATGFFLTSAGDCKVCQLGCTQCADGSGNCLSCKSGFSQDGNDPTKCRSVASTISTGTVCPDGSFSSGTACTQCSPACQSCTGSTANDCIVCASGTFLFNGACVSANADGICQGSALIGDNNKHECDTCPAKCTSCKIPNFNAASTVDKIQCTGCLTGFFLSNGQCVASCPSGTFVSPQDNLTCTPCDSSCLTCTGSSTFCLSCANNQLASSGKCVSSCPSGTFSSTGSCLPCHPDCASCSGGAFNQCTSCPPNRPVLSNGRCLPTCSKTQFFDGSSSTCQACDLSCSSCSGAGPSNCLACSSTTQVLRGGSCVPANCNGASSVIPGLGVCLSDLVAVPQASGTSAGAPPLPSITGLTQPTVVTRRRPLEWWQILLMALGCAFIFVAVLWLCRRRARKARAKRTAMFAAGLQPAHQPQHGWRARLRRLFDRVFGYRYHQPRVARRVHIGAPILLRDTDAGEPGPREARGWRWRLVRLGERFFGHRPSVVRRVHISAPLEMRESEQVKTQRLREAEEARAKRDYDQLLEQYDYPRPLHDAPPPPPQRQRDSAGSAPSIYSQMTGMPRRGPDPRQPVKGDAFR